MDDYVRPTPHSVLGVGVHSFVNKQDNLVMRLSGGFKIRVHLVVYEWSAHRNIRRSGVYRISDTQRVGDYCADFGWESVVVACLRANSAIRSWALRRTASWLDSDGSHPRLDNFSIESRIFGTSPVQPRSPPV